jgi:hypothetical protein
MTTVAQLIDLLKNCDPNALVVTNAMHRNFCIRPASVVTCDAVMDQDESVYEFDEEADDEGLTHHKAVFLVADS